MDSNISDEVKVEDFAKSNKLDSKDLNKLDKRELDKLDSNSSNKANSNNLEETEIKTQKKRDTNFELLRILAMLMIIVHHYNVFGGILYNADKVIDSQRIEYYIFYFAEYICIIAVNLYVMISGYYMVKSKMKVKKIVKLELELLFYSVLIYAILVWQHKIDFNASDCLYTFFPVISNQYWFMTAYMGLYLLVPFINKLANSLNKKSYGYLIIISTIIFSVVRTIFPTNNILESNGGYSLTWFIYLYLLAGYIHLYFDRDIKKYKLAIIFFLLIFGEMAVRFYLQKSTDNFDKIWVKTSLNFSLFYNQLFILIETVIVFLFFKNIHIKNEIANKMITVISPLTLGVYLIHVNENLKSVLWEKTLRIHECFGSQEIFKVVILGTITIFIVCCAIDACRSLLFKLFDKTKIVKKIDEKLEKINIDV